jgi:hypothetical protein
MPAEQPPPLVLALVLADNGHLDPVSDKYYILGAISAIRAESFPKQLDTLCVYVVLTAGRGKMDVTVRLVDADESSEPIFSLDEEVEFETPLSEVELMFMLEEVEIPEPGVYCLQLAVGGQLLCERRLIAQDADGTGTQE